MFDELLASLVDQLPLANQVSTHPRLPKLIEDYNSYAAIQGDRALIRYEQTGGEFKALLRALPPNELLRMLGAYRDVASLNMDLEKFKSEQKLKNRMLTFAMVIIGIFALAYVAMWGHSSVTGKAMSQEGVLGHIFSFMSEMFRLVFGG